MIQTKTIAILMIAIATVGVIGTAGLLAHANAGQIGNTHCVVGVGCGDPPTKTSNPESTNAESNTAHLNQVIHLKF